MKQEDMIAAVERFYEAITQRGKRADLRGAARGYLEALTAASQEQVTGAVLLLMQRLDDHERRLGSVERRAETADRIAEGASRRASEVARQTDARIDQLRAEQFDPGSIEAAFGELYRLGGRLPALEVRIASLERRITTLEGGDAGR